MPHTPASPGARFRTALREENPLQIAGAITPYSAMLAEQTGFRALYLSGGGVAVSDHGLPDLGITTINDVVDVAWRLTAVTEVPVLADIDTGFGQAFSIQRTIRDLERAGVAAVHMEDQVAAKRCGHRPGKAIVTTAEMIDRLKAAVDARRDDDFFIIARTDAAAIDGIDAAVERALAYQEVGADGIFAEAAKTLDDYRRFVEALDIPVLANVTEGGVTPIFETKELASVGVGMALYPLSAFRAMYAAALNVYGAIRRDGSQKAVLDSMQPRTEMYERIHYYDYENKIDSLFSTTAVHRA